MDGRLARALVIVALLAATVSAGSSSDMSVSLNLNNSGPVVKSVYAPSGYESINPVQASTATAMVDFVASDVNGYADLNDGTAVCSANMSLTTRSSSSCVPTVLNSSSVLYNCSISLQYYDPSGPWSAYCSVQDSFGSTGSMWASSVFTYNSLNGMDINPSSLSFGTLTVGDATGASNDPVVVYNQGNTDMTVVKLRGFDLGSGGNTLGVSNFNVTMIDSAGTGAVLVNDTEVNVPGLSINKGSGASGSLYFWVVVPQDLPAGTYLSKSNWVIAATFS